jgi:hypothetical protein
MLILSVMFLHADGASLHKRHAVGTDTASCTVMGALSWKGTPSGLEIPQHPRCCIFGLYCTVCTVCLRADAPRATVAEVEKITIVKTSHTSCMDIFPPF